MYRSKVLVVPYVKLPGNDILFLLAKDRKHGEWTFISGTCRKRCMEHPIQCATRELKEETKETVSIDISKWPHKHIVIDTTYYEPEPDGSMPKHTIHTAYHCYFINITDYENTHEEIKAAFEASTKKGKHYNENSEIDFRPLADFSKIHFWRFLSSVVFEDAQFNQIIGSL